MKRHSLGGIAAGVPLAASTSLMMPLVALADPADGRYYGHYGMMGWGGWFYGLLSLVIFIALVVGAVVLIVKLLGGGANFAGGQQHDKALAILRERFARGEITQEEFETTKKALE